MELISIAAGTIGAEFLKEAVKFLWSEASKILERYQKRQEKKEVNAEIDEPAPPQLGLPARRVIDFSVVERRRDALKQAVKDLVLYAQELEPVDTGDAALLAKADEVQRLIVEAYGIDAPELRVTGRVRTDHIEKGGEAIGAEAEVSGGDVEGQVDAKVISGRAVGAKVTAR